MGKVINLLQVEITNYMFYKWIYIDESSNSGVSNFKNNGEMKTISIANPFYTYKEYHTQQQKLELLMQIFMIVLSNVFFYS